MRWVIFVSVGATVEISRQTAAMRTFCIGWASDPRLPAVDLPRMMVSWRVLKESFTYSRTGERPDTLSVHLDGPMSRRDPEGVIWTCHVEIPGRWGQTVVSGTSSIQSLAFALGYIRECLSTLMSQGSLSYPSGAAVDLDELFGESSNREPPSDSQFAPSRSPRRQP